MAWEARWRVGSILTVEWSGSLQYLTKTVLPFVGAGLAQVAAGPVRGMEFARASARPQPLSGVGFLGVVGPSMSGVLPYPRANVRPLPLTTQPLAPTIPKKPTAGSFLLPVAVVFLSRHLSLHWNERVCLPGIAHNASDSFLKHRCHMQRARYNGNCLCKLSLNSSGYQMSSSPSP